MYNYANYLKVLGGVMSNNILEFVKGRISELTELRDSYIEEGDYELSDYSAGAIDAYDIVRMKLEG
jgi:hypothetical protein